MDQKYGFWTSVKKEVLRFRLETPENDASYCYLTSHENALSEKFCFSRKRTNVDGGTGFPVVRDPVFFPTFADFLKIPPPQSANRVQN